MKSFDLNAMGVQEMSLQERKSENGGSVLGAIAAFAGTTILAGLFYETLTEGGVKCWEDFKNGYNSARK